MMELLSIIHAPIRVRGQSKTAVTTGQYPILVDPKVVKDYKKALREYIVAQNATLDEPYTGPVAIQFVARRPQPDSYRSKSKKWDGDEKVKPSQHFVDTWCTKPDIDNILKATLDCLEDAVIGNDSRIVEIFARKEPGDCYELEMTVYALDDGESIFELER